MSMRALFAAFFFVALSVNGLAQVTGGSTSGATPGTTGTTPGTTQTIPGTTGTIPGTTPTTPGTTGTFPGTTGTIPGTAGNIPGTTGMPPATTPLPGPTTQLPPPTTQLPAPTAQPPLQSTQPPAAGFPDFSQDNTNISGRFDGNLDRGGIFDTRDNTLTGNRDSIFLEDRGSLFGEAPSVLDNEEDLAIGPETPSALDNGIFNDDRDTLAEDTVIP